MPTALRCPSKYPHLCGQRCRMAGNHHFQVRRQGVKQLLLFDKMSQHDQRKDRGTRDSRVYEATAPDTSSSWLRWNPRSARSGKSKKRAEFGLVQCALEPAPRDGLQHDPGVVREVPEQGGRAASTRYRQHGSMTSACPGQGQRGGRTIFHHVRRRQAGRQQCGQDKETEGRRRRESEGGPGWSERQKNRRHGQGTGE